MAAPGARGRITQGEDDLYTGKAPACIVDYDLKELFTWLETICLTPKTDYLIKKP